MIAGAIDGCEVVDKGRLVEFLSEIETDVVVTFGAGDIDLFAKSIDEALRAKMVR